MKNLYVVQYNCGIDKYGTYLVKSSNFPKVPDVVGVLELDFQEDHNEFIMIYPVKEIFELD